MSARYGITVCTQEGCGIDGLHLLVDTYGQDVTRMRRTLRGALEAVALQEAVRLAGAHWVLDEAGFVGGPIWARRADLPGAQALRFRTWEQVALFLREWRQADRKVVAS